MVEPIGPELVARRGHGTTGPIRHCPFNYKHIHLYNHHTTTIPIQTLPPPPSPTTPSTPSCHYTHKPTKQ